MLLNFRSFWGASKKLPSYSLVFSPEHSSLTANLLILASFAIWIGRELAKSKPGSFLFTVLPSRISLRAARRKQTVSSTLQLEISGAKSPSASFTGFPYHPTLGHDSAKTVPASCHFASPVSSSMGFLSWALASSTFNVYISIIGLCWMTSKWWKFSI